VSDVRPFSIGIRFEVYHSVQIDCTKYVVHWWTVLVNSDIFCVTKFTFLVHTFILLPHKEHLKTSNHHHYYFLDALT
jgi:hypothetical protein